VRKVELLPVEVIKLGLIKIIVYEKSNSFLRHDWKTPAQTSATKLKITVE